MKKRRDTYRKWQCPTCGNTIDNPIPAVWAECQRVLSHPSRATVAMKPVTE